MDGTCLVRLKSIIPHVIVDDGILMPRVKNRERERERGRERAAREQLREGRIEEGRY